MGCSNSTINKSKIVATSQQPIIISSPGHLPKANLEGPTTKMSQERNRMDHMAKNL